MRKPSSRFDSSALRRKRNDDYFDDLSLSFFSSSESSSRLKSGLTKSASSSFLSLSLSLSRLVGFSTVLSCAQKKNEAIFWVKKRRKIQKKFSHKSLFVFVCLLSLTNPIKSSFNLFRVLSLCSSLSKQQPPLYFQRLFSVFCSVPQSLFLLRFLRLLFSFHETTRESEIYITHRRRSTNVATTDDERTISKSKVGTVLRAL